MTGQLIGIQQRFRELGRIRLGEQATKNGKKYPKRLSDFRLTSASKDLLDKAAEVYGGEVREWQGAPTEGTQYELLTGTDRLDVILPPGDTLSQSFELWSGGGCVRRCNGAVQDTGAECACPSDLTERGALSKKGEACSAVTRLSLMLPRVPDLGTWRLETRGYNAAVELPGTINILRAALQAGQLIPAQLRLDNRTSKKDGQTRHFVVPVLELPTITTAELMNGSQRAEIAVGGGASNGDESSEASFIATPTPQLSKSSSGGQVADKRPADRMPGDDQAIGAEPFSSGQADSPTRSPKPPLPNEINKPKAKTTKTGIPAVNQQRETVKRLANSKGLGDAELAAVIEEHTGGTDIQSLETVDQVNAVLAELKSWGAA